MDKRQLLSTLSYNSISLYSNPTLARIYEEVEMDQKGIPAELIGAILILIAVYLLIEPFDDFVNYIIQIEGW